MKLRKIKGCGKKCALWKGCRRKYFCKRVCKKCNIEKALKNYLKIARRLRYQLNKERVAEYQKQYIQTPAGKASAKACRYNRRILKKSLTKETVQRVYEDNIKRYGRLTCILCFKPIKFGDDSLEHLTPLSRGGNNDYENLGIAHRSCNSQKHTKTLDEWFAFIVLGMPHQH